MKIEAVTAKKQRPKPKLPFLLQNTCTPRPWPKNKREKQPMNGRPKAFKFMWYIMLQEECPFPDEACEVQVQVSEVHLFFLNVQLLFYQRLTKDN